MVPGKRRSEWPHGINRTTDKLDIESSHSSLRVSAHCSPSDDDDESSSRRRKRRLVICPMAYHSAATYNTDGFPSGSALRPLASGADELLPPELLRQTAGGRRLCTDSNQLCIHTRNRIRSWKEHAAALRY